MTPIGFEPPPPVPTDRLIRATVGAFVVALLIVVSIVLPVEYNVDPLHTGAAFGLLRTNAPPTPVVVPTSLAEAMTPKQSGPSAQYLAPFQTDRATFELGPYDYLEYKYHLAAGAALVYSWEASAQVIHDFHGAPDASAGQSEPSLDKESKSRSSGSLIAPFTGMHGWYWENPGGTTVTITLTTAGYYSAAIEYRSDRTRVTHDLAAGSPATPQGAHR